MLCRTVCVFWVGWVVVWRAVHFSVPEVGPGEGQFAAVEWAELQPPRALDIVADVRRQAREWKEVRGAAWG